MQLGSLIKGTELLNYEVTWDNFKDILLRQSQIQESIWHDSIHKKPMNGQIILW